MTRESKKSLISPLESTLAFPNLVELSLEASSKTKEIKFY